jgi:hypothetical protein
VAKRSSHEIRPWRLVATRRRLGHLGPLESVAGWSAPIGQHPSSARAAANSCAISNCAAARCACRLRAWSSEARRACAPGAHRRRAAPDRDRRPNACEIWAGCSATRLLSPQRVRAFWR